jgi:hypothetical protein
MGALRRVRTALSVWAELLDRLLCPHGRVQTCGVRLGQPDGDALSHNILVLVINKHYQKQLVRRVCHIRTRQRLCRVQAHGEISTVASMMGLQLCCVFPWKK